MTVLFTTEPRPFAPQNRGRRRKRKETSVSPTKYVEARSQLTQGLDSKGRRGNPFSDRPNNAPNKSGEDK